MDRALREFTPQLIVYNAGTDILEGDPLGCLSVSGPVINSKQTRSLQLDYL